MTAKARSALNHSLAPRDEDDWIHVEEQPVLHHPHDSPEALSKLGRVREGKEAAVQDIVPVVGDEGAAVAASNLHHPAYPLDRLLTPVPGEGDHLNREMDCHAEVVHQLPVVDHDDVPPAGEGHDLFAEKRPPRPLIR